MFSTVQVKQEYSGVEDNSQNNSNMQGASEYPVFSNQDVEYMYRQLPYFWNQPQLQMQLSDDLPSENEAPARQEIPQVIINYLLPAKKNFFFFFISFKLYLFSFVFINNRYYLNDKTLKVLIHIYVKVKEIMLIFFD